MKVKKFFGFLFICFLTTTAMSGQSNSEATSSPDGSSDAVSTSGKDYTKGNKGAEAKKASNINFFEAARASYIKKEAQKEMIRNGNMSEADKAKTSHD